MNRLKATNMRTILEEKRLSTEGVVDRYPTVWDTLRFHKFEQFTKPQNPYVPTWVKEFYESYAWLLPKGKKKTGSRAPQEFVERIVAEYLKDEFKWRRAAPMDTSPVVDVETMEMDTSPPTMANELKGHHELITAHDQALDALTTRVETCNVDISEGPSSEMPSTFEIPLAIVTEDANVSNDGDESDASESDEEELVDH
ncbi:hypothetical protein MTR67_034961 [Solanum verrucosum]|uniref:Integrase core domain containing protein n=1 Tax=Solanum verrucosum TaxID=315347 RepID=A0AAF0U9I8_SOLVR|nr:hypothetical protein MTR67_034961 [Solanum verrucosum]